jgi:hypothetical protein
LNIQDHSITELAVAPPIIVATIMAPMSKKYNSRCVRSTASGAAPLDHGLQKVFEVMIGDDAPFTQIWVGSTETRYSHGFTSDLLILRYDGRDLRGHECKIS